MRVSETKATIDKASFWFEFVYLNRKIKMVMSFYKNSTQSGIAL